MKKLLWFFVAVVFMVSPLLAQDHLLITEFVVTPTAGEFIEIYNPTDAMIDLTNYYITDATFAGGPTYYYQIVEGGGGGGSFGDFNARFPAGATIAAGEHQTIALNGSTNFMLTYNVEPTYELYEDDVTPDAIPDMLEAVAGSINGQGGLTNDGEVIILYYWDGVSDLVQDVDYVVWGDKAEAVDKSGVVIDGPDADTDGSMYAADTPIADQYVVNTDNDADGNPHDDGMSAQRRLDVEDVENWGPGGNGMTGHDETSENTSWKGGIWSINEPPTPGRRALTDKAPLDSLTIADVNFVRQDSIGVDANDDSPFVGDTLTITGTWMQGTREVALGNRWGGFMEDERGGPWSGFFIIQNDTSAGKEGTLITAAQTGDVIRVKGIMSEFPTSANTPSITQFVLITDPITPIEFVKFGQPLPDPVVLTPGDLGLTAAGNSADPQLSERWEGVLARFENLTIINNDGTAGGNTMIAGDETGNIVVDDYFSGLSDLLDASNGVWPGLPAGTVVNVTGFVRGATSTGLITINPRNLNDIEVAASPPIIENFTRSPATPTSGEAVEVSGVIRSATSTITNGQLFYSADGGAFQSITMTNTDSLFSASIPQQADGSIVEYFIFAEDASAQTITSPVDTAAALYFYRVRDNGPTIFDVQYTPFDNGNSGYLGLGVTVTGIVTTDSSDFSFYWIQDGTDPWSGVNVSDNVNNVKIGDEVTVTGTVREQFNETQIFDVTSVVVNSSGNPVPAPVVEQTGNLTTGSPTAEQWEGMLMRVENIGVTDPRPDGFPGFGEFTVDDGSGGLRVDDLGNWEGQTPKSGSAITDTAFVQGDSLLSITGIQYFSFSDYKLVPRNESDVVRMATSVEDGNDSVPNRFALAQNYPNPFNPQTTIRYQVAQKSEVKIEIFNILGQRVKTLVDKVQPAGSYSIQWRGTNDRGTGVSSGIYIYQMRAGDFVQVQKMLFLK